MNFTHTLLDVLSIILVTVLGVKFIHKVALAVLLAADAIEAFDTDPQLHIVITKKDKQAAKLVCKLGGLLISASIVFITVYTIATMCVGVAARP